MKKSKMTRRDIIPRILFSALLIPLCLLSVEGQQKEVRVVKPYSPTLSGAEKIQLLPSLDEEIEFDLPGFTYQLYPKLYPSEFKLEPIKAARMVQMPLKKLYKTELTAGLGNYWTPYAELKFNQLRSREGAFGLTLRHHSMNGKLKLEDERKIPAGFSENSLEAEGSRFLKRAVFDYRAGASYDTYIHYGFDPDTLEVPAEPIPERDSLKHGYFTAGASLGLHSSGTDSSLFKYNGGLEYYYFTHGFEETEHGAKASLGFHKGLDLLDISGEAGGAFYGHYPDWDTIMGNHTMAWLNPRVSKRSSEWQFSAGVNMYLSFISGSLGSNDKLKTFHLYPHGTFEFNIVREVIVPYFGVDGYLESNHNRKIVDENPYIVPALSLRPTNHKLIVFAGLKGRVTDKVAYNFKGSYSIIDDQYFFVNDTSLLDHNGDRLKNQFTVEFANTTLLRLQGEIVVRPRDNWKVFLKGNFYSYTHDQWSGPDPSDTITYEPDEDHPWNKPSWDVSLQARYNMGDKILVDLGIYTIGSRYYKIVNPTDTDGKLPWILDANLGVEYRYTKLLSFWLRINNIAAQQYYLYNQYPAYRFRAMLGFTYAL